MAAAPLSYLAGQRDTDRAFVRAHHAAPAPLHHVDTRFGLHEADFTALDRFARTAGR
ncbi:hypothetical protein [Streptomyces sp. CRN 30]|uniref:hypothetical protein n=1 Tax=Streptomyces sp. CRN 30 TaxID=3075613 RepID=UPI002A80770C|nr:hypothetical protein [Streptomyces sp. CRN 30]